ncbi:MAG TPA: hypothetical protein VFE27_12795 [Acidobacteriaceae bacterium]|jgi:hypothetical protein|nr:hypothetical protein [Acidobacteriaceae bacterium]
MRKPTSFACLFAFGLFFVGCRSDEPPIHPTAAPTTVVNPAPPPRIFCDHGEITALSWSLSSLVFTNASIQPKEQLTLVLETPRDTFKVPLKRSGTHPQDPYRIDQKYADILLPREGVIEVVRPAGNFAAFCGVGLRYPMPHHY